jgi:hypothetical protein
LAGSLSACGHPGNDTRWGMSEAESTQLRENDRARGPQTRTRCPAKQLLGVLGDKLQAQRKALVGQGGDPRAEMQALLAGPRFERERAQALVNDKTEALRRQSPEVIAAFGDFYDSLRPEQQQRCATSCKSATATASAPEATRSPRRACATIRPMPRILLIDDDTGLGPPLAAYFARFELQLEQALRPSEGLARLAAGGFDAAILDVMLPEMDGFALCREIRKAATCPSSC